MDAVILYVDGSDPVWQKQYRKALSLPMEPSRFRDWGTLPYLFRGIDKYMPFIENIFLVVSTESQVPSWIDREKVKIVLHRDIIPEEYLPNFNSCVIETHIPYIKDLSEEFLYFNDDMFPINPCTPDLFFKDGRPQDRLTEKCIIYKQTNLYHRQCYNSTLWAKEALGQEKDTNYFYHAHWPHPLLKSYCLEILEINKERFAKQISKLRTFENVNQHLFTDYLYIGGLLDNVSLPYKYADGVKMGPMQMKEVIESDACCVCINDTGCEKNYDAYCRAVLSAFKKRFPEKSRFERLSPSGGVIISMTSFPARIGGAAAVWKTILNQKTDTPFKCVMTLAEEEFPSKEIPSDLQSLVDTGQVELLWYPRNIRSHKKIIPVLQKYPDATVITTDDDIQRPQGWLQVLLEDHKKYPEDIITNGFAFYLDKDLNFQRLRGLKQAAAHGKNHIPGIIYNFCRFLSGSGTLFPAHTFTDSRFFQENLYMTLSPTSDESWTYLFSVLKGKTIRQTHKVYDESATHLPDSQDPATSLYKVNRKNYPIIFERFFQHFPEFKYLIQQRQRKVIVSLTSYPARFKALPRVLDSLTRQTLQPSGIVLTLYRKDAEHLTEKLREILNQKKVELLIVDEDLKPHNKYFYAMREYPDYAVITVDDDIIYQPTLVEKLMEGYWSHPDCVIARRVHKIRRGDDGTVLPYNEWQQRCKDESGPSEDLFATGVGGVLYPPNILDLSEENKQGIKEVLFADDIYLKHLEQKRGIKIFYTPDVKDVAIKDEEIQSTALYRQNVFECRNDQYIKGLLV